MRIVDLTKPIQFNEGDPAFMQVQIKHFAHAQAEAMLTQLGLTPDLYPPNFEGWADDLITHMGVHSTTHIDAPWHYGHTCEGKPARTIDEIPLEWCFGEGLVIDMTHKKDYDPITQKDIEHYLQKHDLEIRPNMIVLIHTGRDKLMGTMDFFLKGTGMSAEATEFIIDKGVKVMGIDQWGWDLPIPYVIEQVRKKQPHEVNHFWEGHLVGRDKEYCHIEQLTNLQSLPPTGFKIAVFPLKIVGGSAAPARVVAMFD